MTYDGYNFTPVNTSQGQGLASLQPELRKAYDFYKKSKGSPYLQISGGVYEKYGAEPGVKYGKGK